MQKKTLERTKNSFPETPEQLQNLSACTASDRSQQMSRAPIHSSTAAAPPSCAAIRGCSQLRPRRSPRSGRGALAEWPMLSQTYGTRWAQNNATLSLTGRRSLARRPETHPYILYIYIHIYIYTYIHIYIYTYIYIYAAYTLI